MKTTISLMIPTLGLFTLLLNSCQSNSIGYAPDFYKAQLASADLNQEPQEQGSQRRSHFINLASANPQIGFEKHRGRLLVRHNGGRMIENGALVATVANLGNSEAALSVNRVPAENLPPQNLMAVSALEDPVLTD